ncbi:TIGR03621 family F420-dependent LLM class oxidoreductase [Tsukamurella sp. 8F]|uniref:TIGR03621 family F420-dependent LLM class oxidoreductase n=1 Tax=unclassified Tsukamurella TaxID=2633480 RepID=UPI0023B97333|nr:MULTISPECIES: TIGR03621 family F420-dependent LLM class oxidoreductase [unclassified Tsukamurella]MDF0530781.1 TIGR03621 family F420-dependent LLM class oxidoreductase [Tsukamurella sp. 8J]MDF0588307.1 TIGR03621 family F420-dependent LLM class oxidoreductase [Tsukamurella sp. 8F]
MTTPEPRKFRFAAGGAGNSDEGGARKFVKLAQEAEELGFDTFAVPDRLDEQVGPLAALGALAVSTDKIRLATSMLSTPFRHPAVLAKELTTIDVLSKGRLEVGLGVGAFREDFDKAGIPFDSPAERIARFDESLTVLDKLLRGEEAEFEGEVFQVKGIKGYPRPRQGPRPKIAIGAGGPRMLELAARRADVVSINPRSNAEGKMRISEMSMESTKSKVEAVAKAAGDRFADIELSWTIAMIVVTDDREQVGEYALKAIERGLSPSIEVDKEITIDDVLGSPYLAIGTFDEIAEQVRHTRAETSMSYVGVVPTQMEAFAPVLEQLRGE